MERKNFYQILKQLGSFRCDKDLRKFNNQRKKNPNLNVDLYLGHFGYCKSGQYHSCDFFLNDECVSGTNVFAYQKMGERDGMVVRLRSSAFGYFGRGRRWKIHKSKKE